MRHTLLLTFDLNRASAEDYETTFTVLAAIGLVPFSPAKRHRLPSTTVMGETHFSAQAVVAALESALRARGIGLGRVAVMATDGSWFVNGSLAAA